MNEPSLAKFSRWRAERRKGLVLAAAMLMLLLAASGSLLFSAREARQAHLERDMAQRERQNALQIQAQTQFRGELEKTAQQLLRLAETRRATPRHWAKRFVDLRQIQLARGEANRFFGSLVRAEDRLFHAEAFDLAVTGNDNGLFHPSGNSPLLLTVRGTLLFHAGEGRP
jgi:hypothetical protein